MVLIVLLALVIFSVLIVNNCSALLLQNCSITMIISLFIHMMLSSWKFVGVWTSWDHFYYLLSLDNSSNEDKSAPLFSTIWQHKSSRYWLNLPVCEIETSIKPWNLSQREMIFLRNPQVLVMQCLQTVWVCSILISDCTLHISYHNHYIFIHLNWNSIPLLEQDN